MRPRILEIEGLQSFRDIQRSDFAGLGETGLFGIFGPTGSGKSTVLDAITFALYGKVHRAERGTQGIINANLSSVRVSFTFELLKGGSRKSYRVERVYNRKKGTDNSCEPKIARLIEVSEAGEIPLCDRAMEVSGRIEELLGLNHDDFTRAVVLPQNKFQEFLLLDNSKKRDMLERIFYLEEYGRQLTDKLLQKLSLLKNRISNYEGALSMLGDASDEAVKEAGQMMETAIAERDKAEKELKLLEVRFNDAKEVWQLVQELEHINQKEQGHLFLSEAVNVKRAQFEKAVKADGLTEMIIKSRELSGKLDETLRQLDEVCRKLPGTAAGLSDTRRKYEDIRREAEIEQPRLVGIRTRLSDALGIKAEIKGIDAKINELKSVGTKLKVDIANKDGEIQKEKKDIEAAEQSLVKLKSGMEPLKVDPDYRHQVQEGAKLESEVENSARNMNELRSKLDELNSKISGLEQKLNNIKGEISGSQHAVETLNAEREKHEGLKPGDRNEVIKYKEEIHNLRMVYGILKLKKAELDVINSRIAKLQAAYTVNLEKMRACETERTKAEAFYEHCRQEMDNAINAVDRNTAYMLSRKLKEGEPCPVCGSELHPNPAVESDAVEPDAVELTILEQQVENARKQLADAEKAFKEAENKRLITGEQIKAVDEQVKQITLELEIKTGEYNETRSQLPENLRTLEPEQLNAALDRMNTLSDDKLKAIDEWEKKLEAYNGEIQKLNEQLSKYKLAENGIAAELKVNRDNREQAADILKEASRIYNDKQQAYSRFLNDCKIESAAAELKRIAENDRKINLLQKQMEQVQELLQKKRAFLDNMKEVWGVLTNKHAKVEADSNNFIIQKSEKEIKLKELAGDLSIEDEIQRIDAKLGEYSRLEKQLQESLKSMETLHNQLSAQKTMLENQRDIYAESVESEKERLKTSLPDKGFSDSDEVEKSVLPKEKQRTLNEEINEFDKTERNIQAQKGMALKRLDKRSITEEEWNAISNAYREKAAWKEECVSHSEVAKSNFNMLKEKHDKWIEINKSFNDLTHKYGLFEQIQKLLRADKGKDNSFIDFIAEERLRYVAAKASETLGLMTKYKYALELDADTGFIIRDNANGGVHRMVSSLSGGETFLTALSLALALSEQIQLKGQSPLEFFFLDEGFGTLDNNLLDTVIDSLERLSKKERVIGLISHVPELRNRISRRLIVEPAEPCGRGSRVRVEKG